MWGKRSVSALVYTCIAVGLIFTFQNCGEKSGGGSATELQPSIQELDLDLNAELSVSVLSVAPSATGPSCDIFIESKHPEGRVDFILYVNGANLGSAPWKNGDVVAANTASGMIPCESFTGFVEVASGSMSFQLELVYSEDQVSQRSSEVTYAQLMIPPGLANIAVDKAYTNQGHSVYLFSDYTHCKYTKASNEVGLTASDADFMLLLARPSGGVCNGSYNGTGVEPTDWTYGVVIPPPPPPGPLAGVTGQYAANNGATVFRKVNDNISCRMTFGEDIRDVKYGNLSAANMAIVNLLIAAWDGSRTCPKAP